MSFKSKFTCCKATSNSSSVNESIYAWEYFSCISLIPRWLTASLAITEAVDVKVVASTWFLLPLFIPLSSIVYTVVPTDAPPNVVIPNVDIKLIIL